MIEAITTTQHLQRMASTSSEPTHSYDRPDDFAVTLTARNSKGEERSVTVTNAVCVSGPAPPGADFVVPAQLMVARASAVLDRSTGLIRERHWDFGDGTPPVNGQAVQNAFLAPGKFTVTLACIGPGGTSTRSNDIQFIPLPAPVAALVLGSERPVAKEPVRFLSRSLLGEGADQFLPSIHSMSAQAMIVRPEPSWVARNKWALSLGLSCLIATVAGTGCVVTRRAWVERRGRLRGILRWKPVETTATRSSHWFLKMRLLTV